LSPSNLKGRDHDIYQFLHKNLPSSYSTELIPISLLIRTNLVEDNTLFLSSVVYAVDPDGDLSPKVEIMIFKGIFEIKEEVILNYMEKIKNKYNPDPNENTEMEHDDKKEQNKEENKYDEKLLAYITGKQKKKNKAKSIGSIKTIKGGTLFLSRFDQQQLLNIGSDMDHYGNVGSPVGYLYQAAAIIISRKDN